jgi:hypothetical protein
MGAFYTAIILLVDAAGVGIFSFLAGRNLFSYYTLILLVEAAGFLFTGGFRKPAPLTPTIRAFNPEFSNVDWSLVLTGIMLLASSFILAYPLK